MAYTRFRQPDSAPLAVGLDGYVRSAMAFAGYGSAGYASARLRCGPLRFGHTTQRDGGDQHVRLARSVASQPVDSAARFKR